VMANFILPLSFSLHYISLTLSTHYKVY